MKIKKTIHVTKTAIRKGAVGSSRRCAVARGCKFAGLRSVSVDAETIEFSWHGRPFLAFTPKRVARFVRAFDGERGQRRASLKPFSFVLKAQSFDETDPALNG